MILRQKHSSELEAALAKSRTMDGEVAELQADLGALSAQQLKMDTMCTEETKISTKEKADLEQGTAGIQRAMGVLVEHCGTSVSQMLPSFTSVWPYGNLRDHGICFLEECC